jgi:hypothetical protein
MFLVVVAKGCDTDCTDVWGNVKNVLLLNDVRFVAEE